jgi:tetratricopeptide (TPR) repeat protein
VQAGHWRTSRGLAGHAARVAPSWLAYLDLGITAQLEGSPEEALGHLRRSRELEPANSLVWYNLGWVHERRREWDRALESYGRAAALGPRDPVPPTALGVLLSALGRQREAVPWLETAVRLAPESARAHSALGGALQRLGEAGRAEAHLSEALRLHPGDVDARLDLARLRLAQGRRREAAAHLAEVLRRDPGQREARALLGRIAAERAP